MGIAYYPTQTVETVLVGTDATAIGASFLLLSVDGIVYANGYRINYDRGYRLFSPVVDSNGNISIVCVALAYGEDLPAMNLSNVEVHIIA